MNTEKCLRHQIEEPLKHCRLCASKRIGRGDTEEARKIFVYGTNHLYQMRIRKESESISNQARRLLDYYEYL
jgi:hypothetical protein